MDQYIVLLIGTLTISALLNIALAVLVRYLSISPSFGIPVQAIGRIRLWTTIAPRIWIYGDMDQLGLVNGALTTEQQAGVDRWNEIMRDVQRRIRADDRFLVYGGDEFGWSISTESAGRARHAANARLFCERVQALLRDAPYRDDERDALYLATGRPYASITLAWAYSAGWRTHRTAFHAAQMRVTKAKPKKSVGQRGQILEVTG